jgi:hypothetical protein
MPIFQIGEKRIERVEEKVVHGEGGRGMIEFNAQ